MSFNVNEPPGLTKPIKEKYIDVVESHHKEETLSITKSTREFYSSSDIPLDATTEFDESDSHSSLAEVDKITQTKKTVW